MSSSLILTHFSALYERFYARSHPIQVTTDLSFEMVWPEEGSQIPVQVD